LHAVLWYCKVRVSTSFLILLAQKRNMQELQLLETLHKLVLSGHTPCTDSRKATKKSLFFALKGDHFNGNEFAVKAVENGCSLAIVDEPVEHPSGKIIRVANALETLQQLGLYHRQQFRIPVIGLTGSNGKTTTKELTNCVLSEKYQTLATAGNLNNHIGVPLTLLGLQPKHQITIIEMGANHLGEIALLSRLSQPGYGLITNIGKAHLEGFGSVANILKGKTELYDHVGLSNGILFVNGDNPKLIDPSAKIPHVLYGTRKGFHVVARLIQERPYLKIGFTVEKEFGQAQKEAETICDSQLVGLYNFENIVSAITIGLYFGVTPTAAARAIASYRPQNSRSQVVDNGRNTILLDAYNANPTSMAAALGNFSGFGQKPRAALLGDMLELGDSSLEEHQIIADYAKKLDFEVTLLVGREFSKIKIPDNRFQIFAEVEQARQWLIHNPLKGYHILLKGSRGIQMEKTLDAL